jgi:hypothetical protein
MYHVVCICSLPAPEDLFNKEKPRPPKFKRPLVSLLNLMESDPAHFDTYLVPVGDPDMEIEWYRNGELLRAGKHEPNCI